MQLGCYFGYAPPVRALGGSFVGTPAYVLFSATALTIVFCFQTVKEPVASVTERVSIYLCQTFPLLPCSAAADYAILRYM